MSPDLAAAALDLARTFTTGGRLVVTAPGRHDHAQHVAVEFIHPAVVGARSLPAVAVRLEDLTSYVGPQDALLILEPASPVDRALPAAALLLRTSPGLGEPELVRWYHILWELVQIGLEHPGLTGGAAVEGGDSTSFLYPFLDAAESSDDDLLDSMRASTATKEQESNEISSRASAANEQQLEQAAVAIRRCQAKGGTVHTMGNGGSSSDASGLARRLRTVGIRAASLTEDPAVVTALANDLGVERIFARQVEASVRPGDVLVAFSTSGSSSNLLAALDVKAAADATVIVSAGYGGGPLAAHAAVNQGLVVDSSSVHRIQEAQGELIDRLCSTLGAELGARCEVRP